MFFVSLVLILFSFPVSASGYPMNVLSSSSATTTFAGFLAVGISLVILVVAKFLYMKYRRLHASFNFSNCSLQSSQRSSSSFFYDSENLPAKPGKAAFFVGFLGSPSWETSIKTQHHKPFMYSDLLQSRRSRNNTSRRSSRFSISEFGGLGRSAPYSNNVESRAFSNTLVATNSRPPPSYASLPAYPADTRVNSSNRRHSLPATNQVDLEYSFNQRKRQSTLKSSRSRRSDSLQDSMNNKEVFLSTNHNSFLNFESSPSLSRDRFKSRSNDSCIPPLPPLPASVLLSPLPDLLDPLPAEGRSFISYPYALSPRVKQDSLNDPFEDLGDRDDLTSVSTTAMSGRPSQVSATLPRMKPKPTRSPSVRSRKSPPIGPSPLRIMTLPEGSLANLHKVVQGISDKENINPESNMTPVSSQPPSSEPEAVLGGKTQKYADLGIGYPSSWGIGLGLEDGESHRTSKLEADATSTFNLGRKVSSAQSQDSSQLCAISDASTKTSTVMEDTDVMLGIIQELVEETSQWDDSLFMDDNFKALIENTRSTCSSSSISSHLYHHSSMTPQAPTASSAPNKISTDSARPQSSIIYPELSNSSNAISVVSSAGAERKFSPKSILKKTVTVSPSHSVELDLALVGSDVVRMEKFRVSRYDEPTLYDMPGAYEHGMVLAPLPESNEELEQEEAQAQEDSHVGLAW
ncbi:hypothetical protein GYMLUDRAFT_238288 [Collybiopsis luxurians FD-317 M1]|nr:hypothetical protein GYMLUDRAFT_238288 [Collybiopsis luxurians FD-317 M1]